MSVIELTGRINENGDIELPRPTNLPPGDVQILIITTTPDDDAEEALWDQKFAHLPASLIALGDEALEDYENGLTEDLDLDKDFGDDL